MAGKLLYSMLYILLFLLAFLLILRLIRSKEGFQNTPSPPKEFYDLTLFFKNYPVEKACIYFDKVLPKIQQSFSLDDSGKKLPKQIADLKAETYIKNNIITGILTCPFELPKSQLLSDSYEFVKKLDDMLLAKAMNIFIFYAANLQSTIDNSKKVEGFLTECSAQELAARQIVPLQCIPPENMKATEQEQINSVDKFDMDTRVSQKSAIAKKLQTLVQNLQNFISEFNSFSTRIANDSTKEFISLKKSYEVIKDIDTQNEKLQARKQDLNTQIGLKEDEIKRLQMYVSFSSLPMLDLVKRCETLESQVASLQSKVESGAIGTPKT